MLGPTLPETTRRAARGRPGEAPDQHRWDGSDFYGAKRKFNRFDPYNTNLTNLNYTVPDTNWTYWSPLADIGDPAVEGHVVRLTVDEGARSMLAAVRALDDAGLEPTTAALREPTLDDVFLSLTGHKAEEATDDGSADPSASAPARTRSRSRGAA